MAWGAARERLVERALALIVKTEVAPGGTAQAARVALSQWRNKSPEHAAAVVEARHRWDALGGMADGLRAHFGEVGMAAARFTEPAGPARPAGAAGADDRPRRRTLLLSSAGRLAPA